MMLTTMFFTSINKKQAQKFSLFMKYFYVRYRCGNSIVCFTIIVYIIYVFNLSSYMGKLHIWLASYHIWEKFCGFHGFLIKCECFTVNDCTYMCLIKYYDVLLLQILSHECQFSTITPKVFPLESFPVYSMHSLCLRSPKIFIPWAFRNLTN